MGQFLSQDEMEEIKKERCIKNKIIIKITYSKQR